MSMTGLDAQIPIEPDAATGPAPRPDRQVTATWTKPDLPQPLRLAVSDDDGRSWQLKKWGGGVVCMRFCD